MKKTYHFGKDRIEFERWCRCVMECKTYINHYRHMARYIQLGNVVQYHECRLVINQYKVLLSSLNKQEIHVLHDICKKKLNYAEMRFAYELIYANWLEIVFPHGKSRLVKATPREVGVKLKEARVNAGYSLSEISRITRISLRTLQRYEEGEFFPRLDYLHLMLQVYGIDFDILFF